MPRVFLLNSTVIHWQLDHPTLVVSIEPRLGLQFRVPFPCFFSIPFLCWSKSYEELQCKAEERERYEVHTHIALRCCIRTLSALPQSPLICTDVTGEGPTAQPYNHLAASFPGKAS